MRTSCGVFVFSPDGRVLICRPSGISARYGWTIPKGHVDEDEDQRDTAARETMEEAGIQVVVSELVLVGEGRYKSRKKRLVAFKWQSPEPIDVDKCKCSTTTKHGWPEVDKYELVEPEVAIEKLHQVQADLLQAWVSDESQGARDDTTDPEGTS